MLACRRCPLCCSLSAAAFAGAWLVCAWNAPLKLTFFSEEEGGALAALQDASLRGFRPAPELPAAVAASRPTAPCEGPLCGVLWDGQAVLGSDGPHRCLMRWMEPGEYLGGGPEPQLCLRPYPDIVSSHVLEHGVWQDCPLLAHWWGDVPCPPHLPNCSKNTYMDIGANIGTCLMQMIARNDVAKAYAFEPSPANLYYLTSSILANPSSASKVALWPVGLGSSRASHALYEEPGNAGNSALDRMPDVAAKRVGQVETVTLDSILMEGPGPPPYIHLAKMDVQGYEGQVLEGASKLLKSGVVGVWKFEVATHLLAVQGTTVAAFFNVFIENGYTLWDVLSVSPLAQIALQTYACGDPVEKEIVATHGAHVSSWLGYEAAQSPVSC